MSCAVVLLTLFANGQVEPGPIRIRPAPDIWGDADKDDRRKYVRFAIDGNPEQLLADFLKSKDLQDLVQKALENPPDLQNFLKKDGEETLLRKLVEKYLKDVNAKAPEGMKLEDYQKLAERLSKDPSFVDEVLKLKDMGGLKGGLDGPKSPDGEFDLPLPKFDDLGDGELSLEDRIGEWFADFLKRDDVLNGLENALQGSPDLQDLVGKILHDLNGDDGTPQWRPPSLPGSKLDFDFKPPELPFKLGGMPPLPGLPIPQLPAFKMPTPNLGEFSLPGLFGFGAGDFRDPFHDGPGVPRSGEWLYLIAAVGLVGLGLWALRKFKWRSRDGDDVAAFLASLSRSIETRTQLRQAFDALALARLGQQALPWNHRYIARHLGLAVETSRAADALAGLYEIARYTPGDDRLSAAEQDAVRDALGALTGGVT